MSKVLLFRRVDGVIGVGFQIEFGGIEQYSIAWPDKAGERQSLDVAEKMGMVVEVAPSDSMKPSDLLVNFAKTENPPPFTPTPEHPEPPVPPSVDAVSDVVSGETPNETTVSTNENAGETVVSGETGSETAPSPSFTTELTA